MCISTSFWVRAHLTVGPNTFLGIFNPFFFFCIIQAQKWLKKTKRGKYAFGDWEYMCNGLSSKEFGFFNPRSQLDSTVVSCDILPHAAQK